MTKEAIVSALAKLPLEDMAWVRRKLTDMINAESSRLYHERKACKHPHIVDQRYGQREDQVHRFCNACGQLVG